MLGSCLEAYLLIITAHHREETLATKTGKSLAKQSLLDLRFDDLLKIAQEAEWLPVAVADDKPTEEIPLARLCACCTEGKEPSASGEILAGHAPA
jgi:hypothetical protein